MDVAVIFDPAFKGETCPAVWIIDSPNNKRWFEGQCGLDPNSAVFSSHYHPTVAEDVIQVVYNAMEHHPSWKRVSVFGSQLTQTVLAALKDEGQISEDHSGFVVVRS